MKALTLKLIDKQGVGTSSEYLALCRGEDDSLSSATLGEGTTARAAYAEAMNAWFTRQRDAFEAGLERQRVTEPARRLVPGAVIPSRVGVTFEGIKSLLEEAALGGLLVDIAYQGERDDKPRERKITPIQVYSRSSNGSPFPDKPDNTYVIATDRQSGDSKQFRLDRMTRAELVG